jgi:hypothetical protein
MQNNGGVATAISKPPEETDYVLYQGFCIYGKVGSRSKINA